MNLMTTVTIHQAVALSSQYLNSDCANIEWFFCRYTVLHLEVPINISSFPYALLLYGAMGLEKVRNWQPPRPAKLLGDWSYSLYLSHLLVLGVIIRTFPVIAARTPEFVAQFFDLGQIGIIDNLTFILTSLVASLIVAVFFFYAFERSLMRYFRKKRRN